MTIDRRARAWLLAGLLALAAAALAAPLQAQCAMCKTALTASVEGQRMAAGFNRGVLFLLAAPFTIVAVIGVAILRRLHRYST